MYSNPFGFIAFYGPWILNASGQYIPPSPYVTGVAVRRYRSEGYQFPPAGVKYQLADAVSAQIPINSAQQNLLNPKGCNAIRTLPGYPQSAVFIWGGRTRLGNPDDAQQKLYQFVNTRVILNVVYGSLRSAFDSQIFNVIDGFGVIYNQIISVGNSILNQLYIRGALFGARPSEAFQVICDGRINPPADLENGIINAKVFVTPVPTLERIQIDLIRVAIGQMQNELDIRGLGTDNSGI
jgi:phage tail sheath protein FI